MKTLVFDIFGDLGHFKKFYTTSSPLTFTFPPPPTVRGMLGAIVGCDKSEYLDVFSHHRCRIAIRILNPIKKIRLGLNHINTKGNIWYPVTKRHHGARTQIRTEFLKDPAYRLYITHNDNNVFTELESNIKKQKTVFSLSLGLSELLAGFRYYGTSDFQEKNNIKCEIASVIPMNAIKANGTVFEAGKKYFKERLAIEMNQDRVVERYESVMFEAQGETILAHVEQCWRGEKDDENIIFF